MKMKKKALKNVLFSKQVLIGGLTTLSLMVGVLASNSQADIRASASIVNLSNQASNQDIVDSGVYGTSKYYLTASGDLHFSSGKFASSSYADNLGAIFDSKNEVVKKIVFDGNVVLPADSTGMFAKLSSLKTIENLDRVDTSNVDSMDGMFASDTSLERLDLSQFNTANVNSMDGMFTSSLLANKTYIPQLKLGINFKFKSWSDIVPLPEYRIPDSKNYTGKWQNVGSGTIENPKGKNVWTSAELMANYNGEKDADTYVWQKVQAAPVTVKYVDENGKKIADDQAITGPIGLSYDATTSKYKHDIEGYSLDTDKLPKNATGTLNDQAQTVTYIYKKNSNPTPTPTDTAQPVTVHYVDEAGHKLAADEVLTGKLGEAYTTEQKAISGYTFDRVNGNTTGIFTKDAQEVTYIYQKNNTPNPKPNPTPVVKKGTVVYALKKIGLYSQKNFSNKTRKVWYHQKSRINRPMFVVKGYATSAKGHLRYLVKDVNHHSKTAGKTGYITVNRNYTLPIYYAGAPKKVTVINPQGVNAYRNAKLSGKSVHYKQGTRLTIKKIVKHHLTTRFVLSNGRYITANKKLVISGTYKMPTKVQAKGALNRYNDVNLRHKNRHYAAKRHQTFKVLGWDYSNADNFNRGDSLRYRVAGGYITANKHLVKNVR